MDGVDGDELADVPTNAGKDCPGREGSRIAIGKPRVGRDIHVMYVPGPELDRLFVITPYERRIEFALADLDF